MQNEIERKQAIAAVGIIRQTIVIKTDRDLTPAGKRVARIVNVTGRMGASKQLRWYVGGRLYRSFASITQDNIDLSREWLASEKRSAMHG